MFPPYPSPVFSDNIAYLQISYVIALVMWKQEKRKAVFRILTIFQIPCILHCNFLKKITFVAA